MKTVKFFLLSALLTLLSTSLFAQHDSTSLHAKPILLRCISNISCPPIQPELLKGQHTISGAFLLRLPARHNLNSVANMFPGVYSINGERPSFRGSRPDATAYYIDGVRMIDFEPVSANFVYEEQFKLNHPGYARF